MSSRSSSDPFAEEFFGRLGFAHRLSGRQLAALKSVFGDATRTGHLVDIRLSLPLPRRRVYLVLLCGPDRRRGRRPAPPRFLWRRALRIAAGFAFALQIALALAFAAYLFL